MADSRKIAWLQQLMSIASCHHTSNGYKQAMLELMNNEGVKNQMSGLTCFNESSHLDEFFETLRQYDNRACYGLKSIQYAFEHNPGCIKTLLVSDHLFRSKNSLTRKIYVDLTE